MPLGTESRRRLSTCHPDLRRLIYLVDKGVDEGDLSYAGIVEITVLCGHRGEAAQNEAFATGTSKSPWPKSKHNRLPSDAVDVAVYPVRWDDPTWVRQLETLHAYIAGCAHALGIDLFDISWDRPHVQRNVP